MDAELKAYLDSLKTYLDSKFSEIQSEFQAVRSEMEQLETRLLTEFWKWGRSSDTRVRRMEHSDSTTVERLSAVEERVFALERRVAGSKG